jgi:hypothetical protein
MSSPANKISQEKSLKMLLYLAWELSWNSVDYHVTVQKPSQNIQLGGNHLVTYKIGNF